MPKRLRFRLIPWQVGLSCIGFLVSLFLILKYLEGPWQIAVSIPVTYLFILATGRYWTRKNEREGEVRHASGAS